METCARTSARRRQAGLHRRTAGAAALWLATQLALGGSARAEPLDASAGAAAAYLPLGASASLALRAGSAGSALDQVMRAQGDIAAAAAPLPVPAAAQVDRTSEAFGSDPDLFGSTAIPVGGAALSWRWREAADAPLPRSARWTREVRAIAKLPLAERVEQANAWVNHALQFASDAQVYGEADHWAGAREALSHGRGDCEDFAVTKLQLLRAAGLPADHLYLVVVRDLVRRSDHAVLAVRLGDRFVVLDNGADAVLEAAQVRDYQPVITFSASGSWVHGFRDPAAIRVAVADGAPQPAAAPAPSTGIER
jgi:predicted transglutaminase-like cysteine proteinase